MYNVLVCDDEKDIVSALRIYLTSEGYHVFEATNGKEAIELVKTEEIHLVLMDIMMPILDGIGATDNRLVILNKCDLLEKPIQIEKNQVLFT